MKKEITHRELTERLSYDPESGLFRFKTHRCAHLVGEVAGSVMCTGYIEIQLNKRKFLAHRLAWFYVNKRWPKNNIDHADGSRDNNAFCNLRQATQAQNTLNRAIQKNNKVGAQGVVWDSARGLYRAYANLNGVHYHLGRHATLAEAIEARRLGSLRLHKEFSPENRL